MEREKIVQRPLKRKKYRLFSEGKQIHDTVHFNYIQDLLSSKCVMLAVFNAIYVPTYARFTHFKLRFNPQFKYMIFTFQHHTWKLNLYFTILLQWHPVPVLHHDLVVWQYLVESANSAASHKSILPLNFEVHHSWYLWFAELSFHYLAAVHLWGKGWLSFWSSLSPPVCLSKDRRRVWKHLCSEFLLLKNKNKTGNGTVVWWIKLSLRESSPYL